MRTIKGITDFGIIDVQTIGKPKCIMGQMWIVAKVPMKYMNAKEPLIIHRILHYATGTNLPMSRNYYTAKQHLTEAEDWLNTMRITAEDAANEVSKYEILNPIN